MEYSRTFIKNFQIRTWTYISNHHFWLKNPIYWQEKTQKIENELSDNLHTSLTNKFIDSSSMYLWIQTNETVNKIEINKNNEVVLDNKKYGIIEGFELKFNNEDISNSLFSLTHVKKSIRNMIEEKIEQFLIAPDDAINFGNVTKIKLNDTISIYWGEEKIGRLKKGSKIYLPIADALNSEFISSEKRLLLSAKLQNWVDKQISTLLNPIKNKLDDNIDSNIRAIAFNCFENLGTLEINNFRDFVKKIDSECKQQLSNLGIRIGARYFYMPNLMKKKSLELNAILWIVFNEFNSNDIIPLPTDGRVSFVSNTNMPNSYWDSIGYICINHFVFRVDVFEKIFYLARKKIKYGPFLGHPIL